MLNLHVSWVVNDSHHSKKPQMTRRFNFIKRFIQNPFYANINLSQRLSKAKLFSKVWRWTSLRSFEQLIGHVCLYCCILIALLRCGQVSSPSDVGYITIENQVLTFIIEEREGSFCMESTTSCAVDKSYVRHKLLNTY